MSDGSTSQVLAGLAGRTPVISPEGRFASLPPENLDAAVKHGFKQAALMTSPEGRIAFVPHENVSKALLPENGFTLGQPISDTRSLPERVLGKHAAGIPRELALGATSALGIPTSETPVSDVAKSLTAPTPLSPAEGTEPRLAALRPLINLVHGIYQNHMQMGEQAHQELHSEGAANKLTGLLHLAGALTPVVGPPAVRAGEAIGQGIQARDPEQIAQGTGQGGGVIAGLALGTRKGQALTEQALSKTEAAVRATPEVLQRGAQSTGEAVSGLARKVYGIKNPDVLTAEQSATKALKPRNSKVNFQAELKTALPDARRAADALGIDVEKLDIAQAQEVVAKAKQDIWGEYESNHLRPNEKAVVDTTPVATTIRSTVTQRTLEQNKGLADRIGEVADTYQDRQLPLADLETRIQELNNETRAIEARYPADKSAAKVDPNNAYVFAERNSLRNLLTSKLDELSGPGATQLRQRYGNLKSLEDTLARRKQVFERQAPESLSEQVGRFTGAGQIAKGGVKILTGQPFSGAADIVGGIATRKAATAAKQLNDSNYLLRQAFRKTLPSPISRGRLAAGSPEAPQGLPLPLRSPRAPLAAPIPIQPANVAPAPAERVATGVQMSPAPPKPPLVHGFDTSIQTGPDIGQKIRAEKPPLPRLTEKLKSRKHIPKK